MNYSLFIARRIYHSDNDKTNISTAAIRIATAGVAIGVAVMIISFSIIIGFQNAIRDKVVGFGSHINVGNYTSIETGENYPICVNDSVFELFKHIEGIKGVQKYAITQGVLKTDDDFLGVIFKGVDSGYDTTFIANNLIEGRIPRFSDSENTNNIVISKHIADKLSLKVGEKVFAYFVGNNNDVRIRRFYISGIYATNLKHFDEVLCLTDFYTAQRLNNWEEDQASGVELSVKDFNQLDAVSQQVSIAIDNQIDNYGHTYYSSTITRSYSQIFSWLKLLDMNAWVILILMISVAGFTMISGLLIIILERTNMIGILKSLGAKDFSIQKIFVWFSIFIIGRGLVIGNILGLSLCYLQQRFGIVKLDANYYYVSEAPVEINLLIVLFLNIVTIILCTFILIAPSYIIAKIHPSKSIRFE